MDFARDDDVYRRLMTVPGVDLIVALNYRATIHVRSGFRRSIGRGALCLSSAWMPADIG